MKLGLLSVIWEMQLQPGETFSTPTSQAQGLAQVAVNLNSRNLKGNGLIHSSLQKYPCWHFRCLANCGHLSIFRNVSMSSVTPPRPLAYRSLRIGREYTTSRQRSRKGCLECKLLLASKRPAFCQLPGPQAIIYSPLLDYFCLEPGLKFCLELSSDQKRSNYTEALPNLGGRQRLILYKL